MGIILFYFLSFDFSGLDDSVGLLFIFLDYFLGSSFCRGSWALMMVDLLRFPRPPLVALCFNFFWDMSTSSSSSFSYESDTSSSLFLALAALRCRSTERERLRGGCFFNSTSVLVRFLRGGGCCLEREGLKSGESACLGSYWGRRHVLEAVG